MIFARYPSGADCAVLLQKLFSQAWRQLCSDGIGALQLQHYIVGVDPVVVITAAAGQQHGANQ